MPHGIDNLAPIRFSRFLFIVNLNFRLNGLGVYYNTHDAVSSYLLFFIVVTHQRTIRPLFRRFHTLCLAIRKKERKKKQKEERRRASSEHKIIRNNWTTFYYNIYESNGSYTVHDTILDSVYIPM